MSCCLDLAMVALGAQNLIDLADEKVVLNGIECSNDLWRTASKANYLFVEQLAAKAPCRYS